MRDMLLNLEREGKQMSGTRGLQAKSDEQTFVMRIDPAFRAQYEILLRNYYVSRNDHWIKKLISTSYFRIKL